MSNAEENKKEELSETLEYNEEEGVFEVVEEEVKEEEEELSPLEKLGNLDDIPVFNSTVKYAYESTFLNGKMKVCPRCQSPTSRMQSGFLYASNKGTRILTDAPIGLFCTNCPTVIIDDEVASSGVSEGIEYRGVFGIEKGDDSPILFVSMNGQGSTYLETPTNIWGIAESVHINPADANAYNAAPTKRGRTLPAATQKKKKRTNKSKNKAARKARKRNRKK